MKYFFSLICILLGVVLNGQGALSKIPATGKTVMSFVPAGYDTLATAKGDLNRDNMADIAVVLKSLKEDAANPNYDSEPPGRLLLVLFKTREGYTEAAKTDSAILCYTCGGMMGDPFEYINISRNVLEIHHYGGSAWRWALNHKFRYQQNDFYLIGETNYSYWNVSRCEKYDEFAGTNLKDYNYLTGQFEEKEISQECKLLKNKKGKRKVEPLKRLSDFNIEP